MAKVEIGTHTCERIYDRNNEFKDVEKFFNELITGESESKINHQLSVWDNHNTYSNYPNIRKEFSIDGIERIYIHHKVWNSKRNYISIITSRFGLTVYLTEKQMDKIVKIVKGLNVENIQTNKI